MGVFLATVAVHVEKGMSMYVKVGRPVYGHFVVQDSSGKSGPWSRGQV